MAAEAGTWIDPPFDHVAGEIIAPVLEAAVGFGRISRRGLQVGTRSDMAGVAETRGMAHGAHPLILRPCDAMIIGEVRGVVEFFEIDPVLFIPVTTHAVHPAFSHLEERRVRRGNHVPGPQ